MSDIKRLFCVFTYIQLHSVVSFLDIKHNNSIRWQIWSRKHEELYSTA